MLKLPTKYYMDNNACYFSFIANALAITFVLFRYRSQQKTVNTVIGSM